MKERIIKILAEVQGRTKSIPSFAYKLLDGIRTQAAEEIIKEMDKACCEKCKYCSVMSGWCEYHDIEITDCEILKCNDFTEMEGK